MECISMSEMETPRGEYARSYLQAMTCLSGKGAQVVAATMGSIVQMY
jgi:hypothetical protein